MSDDVKRTPDATDEDWKRGFGVINGKRVSDAEFWEYVRTHAKTDEEGNPIVRVEPAVVTKH